MVVSSFILFLGKMSYVGGIPQISKYVNRSRKEFANHSRIGLETSRLFETNLTWLDRTAPKILKLPKPF